MKLETERLILRDFVKEDWRRAFEYESDPLYLRYYEWTERTPESVQEFIGWFLAHQQQDPRFKFQLAITLKSNNLLIGSCGVRMDKVDAVEADIGYELDPQHWNHGYATEAARAIDRKSTRLNSSHSQISYAVFCLKKKNIKRQ